MREKIYINDDWLYAPMYREEMTKECYEDAAMEKVRIPHTNKELPYHYFDESLYQFISCYRKKIFAQKDWQDRHIDIIFEGVAHIAKVYLNGALVGEHQGGYTAFTLNLNPYLKFGEENTLVVEVDSRECNNIPPFGNVVDYMTYGGIYREVYIEVKAPTHIQDVCVKTKQVEQIEKQLEVEVEIVGEKQSLELLYYIRHSEEERWSLLEHSKGSASKSAMQTKVKEVKLWNLETPHLYALKVELKKENDIIDCYEVQFGFRTCEFRKDGFYLNGQKVKLLGLNRHQSYPYVGYAMPKRVQRLDADILKKELGLNAVRTAHYPQSQHFIKRCDELGLLVFTEIPGWQHIGDEKWQQVALKHTEEMVKQYRNHPSIILWGVRINESQDADAFYEKTNAIAHQLDDTRQTGGVRFLKKSHLLEDVYTYNDFSHNGKTSGLDSKKSVTSNVKAPYLVSEYNGHMFPTKAFDTESHRLEHAKRHATVIDALFADEEIAGGFGWCMFDYNTHKDFGSGDRICYHGVLNMFRVPKLAASVYASQNNEEDILEISSSMQIGEHPAGYIGEVIAFTNAECVKVYKNNVFVKTFYPDRKNYPFMPHPPILIDDLVGELIEKQEGLSHKDAEMIKEVLFAIAKYGQYHLPLKYVMKMGWVMLKARLKVEDGLSMYYNYIGNWGAEATSYRFEAIKQGQVVKVVEKKEVKQPRLKVWVDSNILVEEATYDVSSVRIQVVDEKDQVLPYYQEVVHLEVEGMLEIIGPKAISINGGGFGTYVKTTGETGKGRLKLSGQHLEPITIEYTILKK